MEKSPKLFPNSNHWKIQTQRVYWYHRHHSYFYPIKKTSTERCCYFSKIQLFLLLFVQDITCLFPPLQLINGNLVWKRFIVPSIPLVLPPVANGEFAIISILHVDVTDFTPKPFTMFHVYLWALIICLGEIFEHTNSYWWSRIFGHCFCSDALLGLFFLVCFLLATMARIFSVFIVTETAYTNCRRCGHCSNRVS